MKMFFQRLSILLLPFALLAAGGCSIFPVPMTTETSYYDLDIPPLCGTALQVEVSPFSSMTSERYRMAVRKADHMISGREFHKWVQTPGSIMTKYLRLAYRSKAGETVSEEVASARPENIFHLSGSVLVFEEVDGAAKLGLRYMISRGRSGEKNTMVRTILVTEKMEKDSPAGFADAMSRAAAKVSKLILADMEAMAKSLGKETAGK